MSADPYTDTWRFVLADGTIVPLSWLVDSQPAPTLGETGSYEFRLVPDGRDDHVGRYEQLLAFRDHAGAYASSLSMGDQPWYSETGGKSVPAGSLLVALRPPTDEPTARGLWGLVDSIDDSTEVPRKRCLVTIDLLYLARLGEYTDHTAVRNTLERPGIGI